MRGAGLIGGVTRVRQLVVAVLVSGIGLVAGAAANARLSTDAHASGAVGGSCSKATAAEVMTQAKIGVDITTGRTPIQQVLCGPFLGEGSSGMVASVAIPSCGFSIGWAVFRLDGSDWQLVLRQDHGAFLKKEGSDIRETIGIVRSGDAHCFPSAERSRLWHWNGSSLVAGPWKVKELQAVKHLFYFVSPSGNIYCAQGDEGNVFCLTRTPRHTATLSYKGKLTICHGGSCFHNEQIGRGAPVLGYGQVNEQGGFRCTSKRTGMTCVVILANKGKGKGFTISKSGVARIG